MTGMFVRVSMEGSMWGRAREGRQDENRLNVFVCFVCMGEHLMRM